MPPIQERRILIGVVFATLGLTSLFLAQGTTGLVGALIFDIDAGHSAAGGATARPAVGSRPQKNRDPMGILRRNIFDSETGPLDGTAVADTEPGDTEPAEPVDPDDIRDCEGSMRLVGAVRLTHEPSESFASIAGASGTALLYRPGMQIDGKELIEVEPWRVLLRPSDGRVCQLAMFREGVERPTPAQPAAAVRQPPVRVRPRGNEEEREGAITQADMESGINRVSDTEFNVQRSLVSQILENQAELMRTARIIPHEQNGRVVGVKMYGIRRNSLLGRLGLQNGDMLRTINGFDMTSPDSALEAYARLRNADHLSVAVVRRGSPMTIDYNVR